MIFYFDMDFIEFEKTVRTINSKQYADDYFRLGKKHQIGCYFYLYVDTDLQIINPMTKKDKGKKVLKSFYSTTSALDCKQKAYDFIIDYATKNNILCSGT